MADSGIGKVCWEDGYIDGAWKAFRCPSSSSDCKGLVKRRKDANKLYGGSIKNQCNSAKSYGGEEAKSAYKSGYDSGYKT